MYDGPKYILGIQTLVWWIRILERALEVRSQLDSELQQNPPGSENPDFTSMEHSFKMADFLTEKRFTNLSLGLNYCSMGLSRPPSRDTVLLSNVVFLFVNTFSTFNPNRTGRSGWAT
jgi:hypothetical protein